MNRKHILGMLFCVSAVFSAQAGDAGFLSTLLSSLPREGIVRTVAAAGIAAVGAYMLYSNINSTGNQGLSSSARTSFFRATHLRDREIQLHENVVLKQLEVASQFRFAGMASCGYHALKNAFAVINNRLELLQDPSFIEERFGPNGLWRDFIRSRPNGGDGEWVETEPLELLAQQVLESPNYSLINRDGKSLSLIDVGEDVLGAVASTMQIPHEVYTHVFFVNTGTGYHDVGVAYRTQHAHWFTVVVKKDVDGKREYLVMDSLGHNRLHDATVRTIITRIEGHEYAEQLAPDPAEQQRLKGDLQNLVRKYIDHTEPIVFHDQTLKEVFEYPQTEVNRDMVKLYIRKCYQLYRGLFDSDVDLEGQIVGIIGDIDLS